MVDRYKTDCDAALVEVCQFHELSILRIKPVGSDNRLVLRPRATVMAGPSHHDPTCPSRNVVRDQSSRGNWNQALVISHVRSVGGLGDPAAIGGLQLDNFP